MGSQGGKFILKLDGAFGIILAAAFDSQLRRSEEIALRGMPRLEGGRFAGGPMGT